MFLFCFLRKELARSNNHSRPAGSPKPDDAHFLEKNVRRRHPQDGLRPPLAIVTVIAIPSTNTRNLSWILTIIPPGKTKPSKASQKHVSPPAEAAPPASTIAHLRHRPVLSYLRSSVAPADKEQQSRGQKGPRLRRREYPPLCISLVLPVGPRPLFREKCLRRAGCDRDRRATGAQRRRHRTATHLADSSRTGQIPTGARFATVPAGEPRSMGLFRTPSPHSPTSYSLQILKSCLIS